MENIMKNYEYLTQYLKEREYTPNTYNLTKDIYDAVMINDFSFKRMDLGESYCFTNDPLKVEDLCRFDIVKVGDRNSKEIQFNVIEKSHYTVKSSIVSATELLALLELTLKFTAEQNEYYEKLDFLYSTLKTLKETDRNKHLISSIYGAKSGFYSFSDMQINVLQEIDFSEIYPKETLKFQIIKTDYDSSCEAKLLVIQIIDGEVNSSREYTAKDFIKMLFNYTNILKHVHNN